MQHPASTDNWIAGIVSRGHGVASGTGNTPYPDSSLRMQAPHFAAGGLDLTGFHMGTLNIDIAPLRFRILQAAYHFKAVNWTPLHPPEDFSFCQARIRLASEPDTVYPALVYYPHPETKIRNQQAASIVEILAPMVAGVHYGIAVELALNPAQIEVIASA